MLCRTITEDWPVVSFEATELDVNPPVLDSKIDDEWLVTVLGKTEFDLLSLTVDNDRLPSRTTELGSRGTVCTLKLLDDISTEV